MVKDKISITIDRDLLEYLRKKVEESRPRVSLSYLIEWYIRLGIEYERRFGTISIV